MSYIKIIDKDSAVDKLKKAYEVIDGSRGRLSNIMKIQSLFPQAMLDHFQLYKTLMFTKSNLSRELKEMIAVIVSSANKCSYCISHHSEALNHYWKDKNKIFKLVHDFHSSGCNTKTITILEYAHKLTVSPSEISEQDIAKLKTQDWTDEDILSANLIISYFNFVNRIALGLGVEFNEEEVKGYNY